MSDDHTPAFLALPDLACEAVGGAAVACNDEFFAAKENLLRVQPAEWREHDYTDRGKWMDGWETRRRRALAFAGHPSREGDHDPNRLHDWCIIRLGLPGVIRGVVVDTAYFRGNFPESCELDACTIDSPLEWAAVEHADWENIVPRSPLRGDSKNMFVVTRSERFTHVRLKIFPDGGVARLRVHGDVVPNWEHLHALGGPLDLAALEHGAIVETCSDMFFGSRNNLIKPGTPINMSDGWETRRRRGPGNDWAIVRLAEAGTVDRIAIDTTHFKGNAPGRCIVEGAHAPGVPADRIDGWRVLLASPLEPHRRHVFDDELRRIGEVTHVKLSVFPDGGVARLRVWGRPSEAPEIGLGLLNAMKPLDATMALLRCCGSSAWTAAMVAARPFENVPMLLRMAERAWFQLAEHDFLEAFAAHPRIGDKRGGEASQREQGQVANAADSVLRELVEANHAYLAKHGFIYIVCASGRSAEAMLADLRERLPRSRAEELRTASEEQAKITRLRLRQLVKELS